MWKNRLGGKSVFAGLTLLLMGVNSVAGNPHISLGYDATMVSESTTDYDRYELMLGEIQYVVRPESLEGEGYIPDLTDSLEGRINKKIHDYSTRDSALRVASHMENHLLNEGFEVLFQCQGIECGDVAGWRLFMSEAIEGDVSSQHYLAAHHQDKQGNEWFIAFYVNEFTDIPRSVIHTIKTYPGVSELRIINKDALDPKRSSEQFEQLAIVEFNFGSAELSGAARETLTNLSQNLMERPELMLEIGGHTDAVGEVEFNSQLSVQRAEKVKAWLVHEGVRPYRLQTTGYGESHLSETDNPRAQANRRVEVRAILKKTSANHQHAKPHDFIGVSAEPL